MTKKNGSLISLKEWAAKNGVSVRTAQRMVRDGRLKAKKMVKHIVGMPADFRIKK